MKVAKLPVIHPECEIKIIDEDFSPPVWSTVGKTLDTPKHLRDFMKKHNLDACWVFTITGRRYINKLMVK